MKRLIFILVAIYGWLTFSQAEQQSNEISKSFKVSKGGELLLNVTPGDISVNTWDKNEISLKIKTKHKDDFNKLDVDQAGNRVRINYIADWGSSNDVEIYLIIPDKINLILSTSSGDISLKNNITGMVSLSTRGGDIVTSNIQGEVSINTAGGDIKTGDVSGKLNVNTSGGDITVGKIKGDHSSFNTMGGDIKIEYAGCDFNAKTFGGDVIVGNVDGNSNISTYGGDIELKNVDGRIEMNTFGGDLSLESCSGAVKAETKGGDISLKKLSGSVYANTLGGNIYAELIEDFAGNVKLKSAQGDIDIKISDKVKATIKAIVKIRKSFNDEEDAIISDFKSAMMNKKSNEVEGIFKINGGGNDIYLNTLSGKISIKKLE